MASARKAALAVFISGDTKQLERALTKAGGDLDRFGKRADHSNRRVGSSFSSMAKRAVGAGAAAVGAYASIAGAKKAIDTTTTLAKTTLSLHKNLGLSVAQASRWAAVAKSRDIDSKILNMSFGSLSKNIVAATKATTDHGSKLAGLKGKQSTAIQAALQQGKGLREINALQAKQAQTLEEASSKTVKQADAFDKLGISQKELRTSSFDQVLSKVADGLAKLPAGADRAALSMKLFGRGWQTVVPLLRGGSDAMNEQLRLADKYGVTFKGKTIKSLEELIAAQRESKFATMGLQVALGAELIPTLTKGIQASSKFVKQMRDGTGAGGKFAKTAREIWTEVKPTVQWFTRAGVAVGRFVEKHPEVGRLAAQVVAVGLAVKGLKFVSAATGFTGLLSTGRSVTRTLVRIFAKRGAEAGVAAGTAAAGSEGLASGAVNSMIRKSGGKSGRIFGRAMGIGIIAGLVAIAPEVNEKLSKLLGAKKGTPSGFGEAIFKWLGGDGIGKGGKGRLPSGKGAGNLKGAKRSMAPFAALGAQAGLSVTSGARPGSITSSGNVSYHSSGEAIDLGGPAGNMLRFARGLRSRYGGRLAELIHTPMGTGIKDGKPHRYGGQVAADHYDHVHVAVDTGKPGVGDGLGKFESTSYGPPWGGIQGQGVTAAGVNLKGGPHIYGIAADPRVIPLGTNVRVQPNPFGHGGTFKVFDTGGAIKGNRIDFYDWRGRQKQLAWGRRTVTVSTATGGSRGRSPIGPTQEAVQKSLDANQRRIDTLRDQLDRVPKTMAGAAQRDRINDQIKALTRTRRGLTSAERGAPSQQDITDRAERSGSRLVNRIAAPFQKGIRAATKTARGLSEAIEDQGTAYGQAERVFGMTDEDLGTPGGKAARLNELKVLAVLKAKTLADQKKRAGALKLAIARLDRQLAALRAARNKARGAKRAKMNERIKPIVDRRDDLAAEAKALGEEIVSTTLDIADLTSEAGKVVGTEDTSVSAAVSATQEKIAQAVSDIDLMERAGLITPEQAGQMRVATLQAASTGRFGALDQRGLLEVLAQLGDASKAQAEAQAQAAAEVSANTQALRDLHAEVAKQNAINGSIIGIQLREAQRALGDVIGRELGTRVSNRGFMPGNGQLARL